MRQYKRKNILPFRGFLNHPLFLHKFIIFFFFLFVDFFLVFKGALKKHYAKLTRPLSSLSLLFSETLSVKNTCNEVFFLSLLSLLLYIFFLE